MTLTFRTNHGINTIFCAFRVKGLAVQYKDDIDSSYHLNNVLINSHVVPWQPYRNILYDTEAYKEAPLYNHLRPVSCTKYVWYHGHRNHISCVPKTEELFQEHFYQLKAPGVEEEEDCGCHPMRRLL